MNNSEIMVSVKCLAYNHAKYIRKMLDGCLMQKTTFKFEIVIHDDASIDGTTEIIKEYEEKYPDIIKPIYQSENQYSKGKMISEEFIYPAIQGKYIAYCEGDDYWTDENKLQMQVDYLEAHPDCSFTFHDAVIVWESGKYKCGFFPEEKLKCKVYKKKDGIYDTAKLLRLGFIPTASIVARSEYLFNTRKFCDRPICGDLPQRLSLSLDGYAYYHHKKMCCYRTGNPNSASGIARKDVSNMERTYNGHCKILNGFNACTNYRWNSEIEYDKKKRYLRLLIDTLDWRSIVNNNLLSMFFTEVTFKTKIKFLVKKNFSGLYNFLKTMRNKIKGV